jgi:hypothetical protein
MPNIGQTLSHDRIVDKLGEGGPASARGHPARELRRGLAEAKLGSRRP